MNLNIDKSHWKKVQFGDVVRKIRNVIDPETYHSEIVIQGGHIKKRDFHIREYENKNDLGYLGPAFNIGFKKSQILYVSRNPHLMKVGYPDFDGICANTTFVLETKDESSLRNDLIPFIMHSDTFIEQSVANVRGGVNPYVNWSDLASISFLLPPKDQQAELAELLWAADSAINGNREVLSELNGSYSALLNRFMVNGSYNSPGTLFKTKCGLLDSRISTVKLKDCISEKPMYGANASSKAMEIGEPRYIRITDIDDDGNLIPTNQVSIDTSDYSAYILTDGDFLFARTGNTVGKTLLFDSSIMDTAVFAGYLIRFRLNPAILKPKFLFYFTKSMKYEAFKRRMIKIGAQPNINSEEYQSMVLPKFSIKEQENLIDKLEEISLNIENVKSKIHRSKELQKAIINQIF